MIGPVSLARLLAVPALVCLIAAARSGPSPVRVTACDPAAPAVAVPGYFRGFYPDNPYYWPDVWGYRYHQPPVLDNATLSIDYMNVSPKTARTVEFGLMARGALVAEVRDVGTFSQNAEIKHQFGLDNRVFPIGTALPECIPLRVTFQDGSKWVNPHLPAIRKLLYGS
jgi:hypothetical protein